MNGPRIASLCSGYEGLGMAVEQVLGGELAFVADNDPGAAKILAHHYPDVPNYGDITTVDWAAVGPVDILTAGFPCTDVSCAGVRAGLRAGTRSGVWTHCARAIGALRPSLVLIENVRGLLNAGADSPMEPCPWCLGETGDEHALRAAGAVLGDMADLGYDAEWATVSAADAGAPHRRERVFIIAWPAADSAGSRHCGREDARAGGGDASPRPWGSQPERGGRAPAVDPAGVRLPLRQPEHLRRGSRTAVAPDGWDTAEHDRITDQGSALAEDPDRAAGGERRLPGPGEAPGGRPWADTGRPGGTRALADAALCGRDDRVQHAVEPGPAGGGGAAQGDAGGGDIPTADTGGAGLEVRAVEPDRDERPAAERGRGDAAADTERLGRPGQVDGASPATRSLTKSSQPASRRTTDATGNRSGIAWGSYEPAIHRWETVLGRPAPRPTEPGRTGERLSPAFVEWMQGLPEGWVTDVPGLSRNAQLKALGNGVVVQQCALALRLLLARTEAQEAA